MTVSKRLSGHCRISRGQRGDAVVAAGMVSSSMPNPNMCGCRNSKDGKWWVVVTWRSPGTSVVGSSKTAVLPLSLPLSVQVIIAHDLKQVELILG